jgi:hypothetical protein
MGSPSPYLLKLDAGLLYPPFFTKAQQLVSDLASAGTPFFAICGTRSL